VRINKDQPNRHEGECLLRHADSVAKSRSPSFDEGQIAWEASTLPLSYTRLLTLRLRGLISISAAEGVITLLVISFRVGTWQQMQTGVSGGQRQPLDSRYKNLLTIRSSKEW
jgi:hypothetical protein